MRAPALTALLVWLGLGGTGAWPGLGGTASAGELQPRIANGVRTHQAPTVGALLQSDVIGPHQLCSGTMIGCETFLTAAHCFCEEDGDRCDPAPGDYSVYLQHAGVFDVASVVVHPDFAASSFEHDVAVVKLDRAVTGISPHPLPSLAPAFGTDGDLVGFGVTTDGAPDAGIKRTGEVETRGCATVNPPLTDDDLHVCALYVQPIGPPGTESNSCPGDSGGPLLVDEGGRSAVAGIVSFGPLGDCASPPSYSASTNVASHLGFIRSQGGADLDSERCGDLPQVGDPRVDVTSIDDQVNASGADSDSYAFPVPDGTAELRVAMNAVDDGQADFVLYLRFGQPPDPDTASFDCGSPARTTQFRGCNWPNAREGNWYATVVAEDGAGRYQLTASVFARPACGDGVVDPDEGCDDGGREPGDGCRANCTAEACGDGIRDPGEECDDGNRTDGDGCSARCGTETTSTISTTTTSTISTTTTGANSTTIAPPPGTTTTSEGASTSTAVPEPAAALLLTVGGAVLFAARRLASRPRRRLDSLRPETRAEWRGVRHALVATHRPDRARDGRSELPGGTRLAVGLHHEPPELPRGRGGGARSDSGLGVPEAHRAPAQLDPRGPGAFRQACYCRQTIFPAGGGASLPVS